MSYFRSFWQKSNTTARDEHDKAWKRSKATAWDEKWNALSTRARSVYLNQMKAPNREGSFTHLSTPAEKLPAEAVGELVAAGFVKVEAGFGKRGAKVHPLSDAFDFSSRLRSLQRYHLLGPTDRDNLIRFCKHAFFNQGELVVERVADAAKLGHVGPIEEGLENFVTTRRWPGWALDTIKAKAARPLCEILRKADGPIPLAKLPGMMKGFKPDDVRDALTELVTHLVAFEDLEPDTLELTVGLLPIVHQRLIEADRPKVRPPLVVCHEPREVGPMGGLEVNDLRVFLLEVVGESPRLRQDGGIFQKEEPRFLAALPPRPAWLDEALKTTPERRLHVAYIYAKNFGFVEVETEEKATWLRLSGKGRNWLASSLEDQYIKIFTDLRSAPEKPGRKSYDYDPGHDIGDSKFLGLGVVIAAKKNPSYYYDYPDVSPANRQALRDALRESFESLPIGVFHTWESVVNNLGFEDVNPLANAADLSKVTIFLDRRPLPNLPERQEEAGRLLIEAMLLMRLVPFDAFRPAVDERGKICIARLPRSSGYFGQEYDPGKELDSGSTRVIVQPDFSIVVIGLDPAPIAELAPFCDRVGGHAGEGVLTFKLSRNSVIRAAIHGLSGPAIVARLKKHASVDVPENVLREVVEWAGWIRMVNVRPVTVVRCPDGDTVGRVVSALGKKSERLSETLVALHSSKFTSAERQKLQEQGILITKEDIAIATGSPAGLTAPAPTKKRGRPKKAR